MSTKFKIILAFAAIYVLWGSTYLGIKFSIETIPPFLMAGTRFILAGGILYSFEHFRGTPKPTKIHWRDAIIAGGFMLLIGNGGLSWAEQRVPSGLASLLITTTPLWMVMFDWWHPNGTKPKGWVIIGIVLGFLGIIILISPGKIIENNNIDWLGAAVLIFSSISWTIGSLYSRYSTVPNSPFQVTSMQMISGGILLLLLSLLSGEWMKINISNISLKSVLSLIYLMIAGSLIGFSAYTWLLRRCSPALVSTSSFVNPIIAVFLGWAVADEVITLKILFAAVIIIIAVIIISLNNLKSKDHKITLSSSDCEPIEDVFGKKE